MTFRNENALVMNPFEYSISCIATRTISIGGRQDIGMAIERWWSEIIDQRQHRINNCFLTLTTMTEATPLHSLASSASHPQIKPICTIKFICSCIQCYDFTNTLHARPHLRRVQHVRSSMCIPVLPETSYPRPREPLELSKPLPWSNCCRPTCYNCLETCSDGMAGLFRILDSQEDAPATDALNDAVSQAC